MNGAQKSAQTMKPGVGEEEMRGLSQAYLGSLMAQCPDKRLSVLTQQSRWFHLHQGKQTTPGSPTHSLRMAASAQPDEARWQLWGMRNRRLTGSNLVTGTTFAPAKLPLQAGPGMGHDQAWSQLLAEALLSTYETVCARAQSSRNPVLVTLGNSTRIAQYSSTGTGHGRLCAPPGVDDHPCHACSTVVHTHKPPSHLEVVLEHAYEPVQEHHHRGCINVAACHGEQVEVGNLGVDIGDALVADDGRDAGHLLQLVQLVHETLGHLG
eukprot:1161645-Pelagomonas_calceolata.AAC.3